MTSDTTRRQALYEHARASWGSDTAETLMDLLPPDRDQQATKTDLALLRSEVVDFRSEVRARFSHVQVEFAKVEVQFADVRAEFADVRSEMRTGLADVRSEMRTGLADVRSEMASLEARLSDRFSDQTRTLMMTFVGTMVSGVGLAFAALHFA